MISVSCFEVGFCKSDVCFRGVVVAPLRYVRYVLFSSHNIYSALLQRIEHCSTRKSTCRLPIYIYIYIFGELIGYLCCGENGSEAKRSVKENML